MLQFNLLTFLILLCSATQLPAEPVNKPIKISRQKCKEYGQGNNFCDSLNGPVVHAGQFPHMVLLGYEDKDEIYWRCSGVLISDEYIFTTAYCGRSRIGSPVRARFGVINLENVTDTVNMQVIKIKEIIVHPDNKPPAKYNDISLLRLEHPVKMNSYVRPACLPDLSENPDKYTITGLEVHGGDEAKTYLTYYKNVQEVSNQECNTFFPTTRQLQHGIDNITHFCAGPFDVVCRMLGGSPIQTLDKNINCMYNIHAISSFGKSCEANVPTVFTKIAAFIDWIENIVWP